MVFLTRLVAQCALGCCIAALASTAVASDGSPGRPSSSGIPSESLPQALAAFADQTGLQLVYLSTLAEGRYSQSAPAGLSPPKALMRLLSGTGIDFVFLNSRTIKLFSVVPPPAQTPVHPTARMPPQFSALEEVVVTATKRQRVLPSLEQHPRARGTRMRIRICGQCRRRYRQGIRSHPGCRPDRSDNRRACGGIRRCPLR